MVRHDKRTTFSGQNNKGRIRFKGLYSTYHIGCVKVGLGEANTADHDMVAVSSGSAQFV